MAEHGAISRVRHTGTGALGRERRVAASSCQNRPDRARRLHGGVRAHRASLCGKHQSSCISAITG